jgi:hypothetical protein
MEIFNPLFIIAFLFSFFNINEAKDLSVLRKDVIDFYQKYEGEKILGNKSSSLEITTDGFFRYKRVLKSNKTEYYSVKMEKLLNVYFYGSEKGGWLTFKCVDESVIFQSYNDPKGNIDSMGNEISFPLKSIPVENLNYFENNIKVINELYKNKH